MYSTMYCDEPIYMPRTLDYTDEEDGGYFDHRQQTHNNYPSNYPYHHYNRTTHHPRRGRSYDTDSIEATDFQSDECEFDDDEYNNDEEDSIFDEADSIMNQENCISKVDGLSAYITKEMEDNGLTLRWYHVTSYTPIAPPNSDQMDIESIMLDNKNKSSDTNNNSNKLGNRLHFQFQLVNCYLASKCQKCNYQPITSSPPALQLIQSCKVCRNLISLNYSASQLNLYQNTKSQKKNSKNLPNYGRGGVYRKNNANSRMTSSNDCHVEPRREFDLCGLLVLMGQHFISSPTQLAFINYQLASTNNGETWTPGLLCITDTTLRIIQLDKLSAVSKKGCTNSSQCTVCTLDWASITIAYSEHEAEEVNLHRMTIRTNGLANKYVISATTRLAHDWLKERFRVKLMGRGLHNGFRNLHMNQFMQHQAALSPPSPSCPTSGATSPLHAPILHPLLSATGAKLPTLNHHKSQFLKRMIRPKKHASTFQLSSTTASIAPLTNPKVSVNINEALAPDIHLIYRRRRTQSLPAIHMSYSELTPMLSILELSPNLTKTSITTPPKIHDKKGARISAVTCSSISSDSSTSTTYNPAPNSSINTNSDFDMMNSLEYLLYHNNTVDGKIHAHEAMSKECDYRQLPALESPPNLIPPQVRLQLQQNLSANLKRSLTVTTSNNSDIIDSKYQSPAKVRPTPLSSSARSSMSKDKLSTAIKPSPPRKPSSATVARSNHIHYNPSPSNSTSSSACSTTSSGSSSSLAAIKRKIIHHQPPPPPSTPVIHHPNQQQIPLKNHIHFNLIDSLSGVQELDHIISLFPIPPSR